MKSIIIEFTIKYRIIFVIRCIALLIYKLFFFNFVGHSRRKRQALPFVKTHTMCGLFVVADYYFFKAIGGSDKRITGEYVVCLLLLH